MGGCGANVQDARLRVFGGSVAASVAALKMY